MRLLLLLLALAVAGCPPAPAEDAVEETPPPQPVVPISQAEATRQRVVDPVVLTGVVQPARQVTVLAEASGRVTRLPVALGDRVEEGAVLAHLDEVIPSARLAQARAQAEQAAAALDLAEADLARVESLHQQGATTDQDLQSSQVRVRSSRAQAEAADAAVTLARRALRDATVRAPFAGVVSALHLELGSVIAPGAPVAHVVDLVPRAEVSVGVPSRELPLVQPGQATHVVVPTLGETRWTGTVSAVSPASSQAHTWPVEIAVDNPDGTLRAGMVARVEIVVGERDGVVVPDGAIVERRDGPVLFVVEDDVARMRAVTLGRVTAGRVEIRSGVEAGESVAVLGSQHLSDGSPVAPYDLPER